MFIKALVLIQILFCSSFLKTDMKRSEHSTQLQAPVEIMGTWSQVSKKSVLSSKKRHGRELSRSLICNVCPKLIFKSEEKGFFGLTDNALTEFTWHLSGDKISIVNNSPAPRNPIMPSGDYHISLKKNPQGDIYLVFNNEQFEEIFIRKY